MCVFRLVVGQHIVESVSELVRTLLDLQLLAIDLVLDVVDLLVQLRDVHLAVLEPGHIEIFRATSTKEDMFSSVFDKLLRLRIRFKKPNLYFKNKFLINVYAADPAVTARHEGRRNIHRVHRVATGVHSIMRVKFAQAGVSGGCTPTPFHYIYHHQ